MQCVQSSKEGRGPGVVFYVGKQYWDERLDKEKYQTQQK